MQQEMSQDEEVTQYVNWSSLKSTFTTLKQGVENHSYVVVGEYPCRGPEVKDAAGM